MQDIFFKSGEVGAKDDLNSIRPQDSWNRYADRNSFMQQRRDRDREPMKSAYPMTVFRQLSIFAEVVLLLGVAAASAQQSRSSETLHTESRPAMGEVFTIECYMPDPESADQVMNAAFEEIARQ
jgi:hypothetical protein